MVENIIHALSIEKATYIIGIRKNQKFGIKTCEFGIRHKTFKLYNIAHIIKNMFTTALMDVYAIDFLNYTKQKRIGIHYQITSLTEPNRLKLAIQTNIKSLVDSLANIYYSANWLEREVYDLFGILFNKHPDIRRILSDYGFEGFPLRKDFPVMGYYELRYAFDSKSIILEHISLTQLFRLYNFSRVWDISSRNSFIKNLELG